ncbi:histidine phosphatase family protein [Nitriliruptoraceae bacterium ZYF776]|nr:histidine phosphatase family protein [Profundirhabdus halotolerans]
MELTLVRHAQPQWTLEATARVDPTLTALGQRQATLAAERLAREAFDLVLVSTATRAQQTVAPLRPRLDGVPVVDAAWLHEIRSPSDWDGSPADEVAHVLTEARDRPREDWWDGLPGGESFRDFHGRVVHGLDRWLAEVGVERDDDGLWHLSPDAPARVLAIAHAGTNSVVLGHLLGLDPEPWEWERFASDHASVTRLATTPIAGRAIFSLQTFSDTHHLPPGHVTA